MSFIKLSKKYALIYSPLLLSGSTSDNAKVDLRKNTDKKNT